MVVVVDELRQDAPQVALAEGNQVIEALPAGGPHPAFGDGVSAGLTAGVRGLIAIRPLMPAIDRLVESGIPRSGPIVGPTAAAYSAQLLDCPRYKHRPWLLKSCLC